MPQVTKSRDMCIYTRTIPENAQDVGLYVGFEYKPYLQPQPGDATGYIEQMMRNLFTIPENAQDVIEP